MIYPALCDQLFDITHKVLSLYVCVCVFRVSECPKLEADKSKMSGQVKESLKASTGDW